MLPAGCATNDREKGGQTQKSSSTRFMYALNTSTISGHNLGMQEYIGIAARAGYDYVEIWVRDLQAYVDAGNSPASLKKITSDHGIRIASAIGFAPWMTGGPAGFEQMEREMEMLADAGCPRIAAPPAGVDPAMPLDFFAVGERYAALLELGRRTGVMPQLEFWGASPVLWHMGQVLMVAAAANDPEVKILPDVYHMFRGGSGFDSLKMLDGNLIDLFHMNDYPAVKPRLEQVDADRVYPGDGVAPLQQILSDLFNMGGEKILSLELFNRDYWKQDPLEVAGTGLGKMKDAVASVVR
jgi:sugar phosphate isomerase/epimerase